MIYNGVPIGEPCLFYQFPYIKKKFTQHERKCLIEKKKQICNIPRTIDFFPLKYYKNTNTSTAPAFHKI